MSTDMNRMKLFSPAFHRSVFLPLLFRKLKPKKKVDETSITFGLPFEYTILAVVAIAFMLFGFGNYPSMIGIIAGILGACGFAGLLFASIRSELASDQKPSLDDFRVCPFLFLVLFGITAGLFFASGYPVIWIKILAAAGGLIVGYFLGIPAGMYMPYLGWMGGIIEMVLWLSMVGLVIVSIILVIM